MKSKTSLANLQPNLNQIIPVITKPIIGEICHQIRFSYGDELRLDFGKMSAYTHPKLAHLCKGSWQFGTKATPWILKQGNQVLISSLLENNIDNAKLYLQQLENKKLINLMIDADNNINITLCFEGDYQLTLEPDLHDDSGLTYWELFMPTEQILTVGPGLFWECKSIHEGY
ncbi:MAG: hypothetical protein HCA25_07685 [Dolichospermum sp. DET50]|nr:hypothetical protein [Dolichospermum sp. DET66]MBS3032166.1 hypothetical protein [Dolichospermum sp. DET67]MBS3037370.1 hypothetical protein [Dolichospermum sp. DET50]QSX69355.1 MAG: hypothetical protein EZY12_06910 [Dolichospermum sp. DET69]